MSDNITISMLASNVASWAQIIAAIGVSVAAVCALAAVRVHRKASTGSTMLACLERYTDVMEHKRKAIIENSVSLAEQYYREIFDLLWSEIQLWRDEVIQDDTMYAWLYLRRKHWEDDDKIQVSLQDGTTKDVKYREEWEKCITGHYYHPNDPYISLIRKVHEGQITTIKDLKKQKGKLKKPKYNENN